jgi:hypothetical protein
MDPIRRRLVRLAPRRARQLREPAPPGATEVKTGDPDAGVEWYVTFESSEQWGWQAKYIFNVDTLFSACERQ